MLWRKTGRKIATMVRKQEFYISGALLVSCREVTKVVVRLALMESDDAMLFRHVSISLFDVPRPSTTIVSYASHRLDVLNCNGAG